MTRVGRLRQLPFNTAYAGALPGLRAWSRDNAAPAFMF